MMGTGGIGIGAFSVFLPTFIKEFGFGRLESQLLTILPYGCGLIGLIFFAWLADRLGQKAYITMVTEVICCAGFIVLLATTNKIALMAGACLVAAGAYGCLVVSVSWVMTMQGGYTKRATAVWICQIFIQCYSIIATQVYRSPPRFFLGHGIALGLYALGLVSTFVLLVIVKKANASREARRRELESRGEIDPDAEKTFEDLGDFHPAFRYSL